MSRERAESGDSRGVSATVGVTLFVAIVVVLAAVVGSMALAFGGQLDAPGEFASFSTSYEPTGQGNDGIPYVNLTHTGGDVLDGDEVFVTDSDGNRVAWNDVWTGGPTVTTGEYVHVDGECSDGALNAISEGEVYRVVHAPADSDSSTVLAEHEIESPPTSSATPSC